MLNTYKHIFHILRTNKFLQLFIFIFGLLCLLSIQLTEITSQDFCQDYYAAQYFMQHKSIYSPVPCFRLRYNAHPPITTLFFLPFTILSLYNASFVWGVLVVGFYIITTMLLFAVLEWNSLLSLGFFFFASSMWPILIEANLYRNIEQLVLLLIVLAWICRRKNLLYVSGIILGIACLLKIWPIILLLGLLMIRQNKVFLAGCVTIVTGIVFSFLVFNPLVYATYLGPIRIYENSWLSDPRNISFTGFLMKLFNGYPQYAQPFIRRLPMESIVNTGFFLSVTGMIMILTFAYWYTSKVKNSGQELLIEGLFLTFSLLIFPLTWNWNIIILLLPYAVIFRELRKLPRQPIWVYLLLGCGFIAMLDPALLLNPHYTFITFLICASILISIVLFLAGQVILLLQLRKLQT